ncbi:MAG: DUF2723 domain-containing protein [Chitinophagaceae bacterium]|nr:DUF2723 domain-containing protein [Chitinophagaceae bacterium]
MNFRKVNNTTGWAVCIVASLVYILTAEKSGSFWDCGEFVASAYKVQLPHPPGAPLFVLLGRFFIILFGDNPLTAAKAANIMNALVSGFTILFLFWTVTHFARKLTVGLNEEPSTSQLITIMGAGVVGALAYTFTDSFWFSAVEGEVYALSSFFTALVFWAMLKWERASDAAGNDAALRSRADRWIVFISFMIGLSIGIHLLGILAIPAMVMIYYYKRYNYTRKGAIWAFIIGCLITGIVQVVVIKWTVNFAGKFDIFFVNNFGLPFFSGFVFFFILLAVLVWFGLRWASKKGWSFLQLGLWCFAFMMLGYSTYVTTLERSNANPAIDMNNVDNPMSLVYYLGREQYGQQPLVYGAHFAADYKRDDMGQIDFKEGPMKYAKDTAENKYVELGREQEPKYDSKDMMLFPRVWDRTNDQQHADFYADWLDLGRSENPQTGEITYEAPTYADNIKWFVTYQMGFMYWRYFMWNFSGRQNDIQGFGNKRDGNWISGLSFIDNPRLGDQSKMPDSLKHNKAKNRLFMLPFLLGILGCVFHFFRDRKDWIVVFLLFFFTGLAIVLYLNQPGNQPRERDYAYAGSFYAFAIWIGLSVVALVRLAREIDDKQTWMNTLIFGGVAVFLVTLLSNTTTTFGPALTSALLGGIAYAVVAVLFTYAVRVFSNKGANLKIASVVSFALCLMAPLIMGFQEWDDHDRSRKTLAPDMARNYLESCAPNAILFTFGDNDTYPLWYSQEVEGVRRDIRIINTSLLGIDWYINQLRYKVNQSDPIDVIWTPQQIRGLSYIQYQPQGAQDVYYDLYKVMKNVVGGENPITTFPVRRFSVPVDTTALRQYNVVNPADSVYSEVQFEFPQGRNYLTLDQLAILNIIAANTWKRPIYFTAPYDPLGFGQYLRKDGLTYRLVPVKNKFPQQNWITSQALRGPISDDNSSTIFQKLMKFKSGGADKRGVYFDEENRRQLLSLRSLYGEAAGNLADEKRKDEAEKLLQRCEQLINTLNMPYAMASNYSRHNQTALIYLEAAYKVGDITLANKLRQAIRKDLQDQKEYYDYFKIQKEDFYPSIQREDEINNFLIKLLETLEQTYAQKQTPIQELPNSKKAADTTRQ